jgi:translation elongation factor EF-4
MSLAAGNAMCLLMPHRRSEAAIGDTLHHAHTKVEPLEGFKPSVPMVYAAVFPLQAQDFPKLEDAITRLALNDRSVTVARESSAALGQGCRLGFLGTLHLDVFRQRLEDEYGQSILVTAPTVPFRVTAQDGTERTIASPAEFPAELRAGHAELAEPVVRGTLMCPEEYGVYTWCLCVLPALMSGRVSWLDDGAVRRAPW